MSPNVAPPPNVAPIVARTVADLRAATAVWRKAGHSIGFVPTMGALHEGHLTLVRTALHHCDKAVLSIFVNPKQFGPNEDFSRYPRAEASDIEKAASAGAELIFAPTVGEMYPDGFATNVHVAGVSQGLCGAERPGHFDGVATVVSKLLLQVLPDRAFFGEKDYQQLQVIRRMTRDLDIPVAIVGLPTVREPDGLALSSRNVYLSAAERQIAPLLHESLQRLKAAFPAHKGDVTPLLNTEKQRLLAAGFASIDYLDLRHADTLAPLDHYAAPARLLVAARLGKTRLIDNIAA